VANGHDREDQVRAERARAVGLFRYSVIREAADEQLSTKQRGRLVRDLAAREQVSPFGDPVRVSRATIDRWIRDWRRGGFDALVPHPRRVGPRTPAQVLDLAAALKREVPARTAAGGDHSADARRLGAGRTHAATALRPAGAEHPPGRATTEGVRPVRSRHAQRAVDRRRVARPGSERP
jgi:hypothetical protein